jgi:hypothetical protein
MIPVNNGPANGIRLDNFIEDMTEDLTDSVSFELMTQAVDLRCGHSFNEKTIVDLSKDPSSYICPKCRAPITDYKANFALRSLAGRVALAPAPVEAPIVFPQSVEPENKKQIEEAEEYFRRGRALCDQGLQEEGVNALFKALELNPNYEKAHDYLEFITDTKHRRRSSLTYAPVAPNPSASPKVQPVGPVQSIKAPVLPAWVFGASEWNKYFGDVGVEPPLPPDIIQRLPELSANNVLVLIPATVNGQPLTLKTLGEFVQKPLNGGHATKYEYCDLGEYVDQPAQSHWALLTRTVLEGSRNKRYKDEQAIISSYSQKTQIAYEIPTVLDAAVCNFMEYVRSGTWLYSQSPWTFTWCQEKYNASYNLLVGGGGEAGLRVDNSYCRGASEFHGVGGLRKSF